jgi:predicted DNA-binding protein (UPF0251 family)
MRRIEIDEVEIVRLYVEEGLRAHAIGQRLGTTAALVYDRLERAGVVRSRVARLPLDDAIRLYVDEGWSAKKIAAKFGITAPTVSKHLRNAGIQLRGPTASKQPRGRIPCPRSVVLRSYMLGFVWGDFNVRRYSPASQTISVVASTTHLEQIRAFEDTFGGFGRIYVWRQSALRASLDMSFEFLFDKYGWEVPAWVRGTESQASFAAGYVDAEGSFGVYEGRARFKLDAYDVSVLHWFHEWCRGIGVESRLRLVQEKGTRRPDGTVFPRDLWRVNVNAGQSILRLIATLEPYLRHGRRIDGAARARDSVIERLRSRSGNRAQPMHRDPGACGPRQEHPG